MKRLLALLTKRVCTQTAEDTAGLPTYTRLDFLDGESTDDIYWCSEGYLVRKDKDRGWVELDAPGKSGYDSCATCEQCGRTVAVWCYNPRLGDGSILHCDSCPNQIHVGWNLSEELTREVWPQTESVEDGLEHICQRLEPCRCGGTFRSGLDPFCPFCHARLDADLHRHFGVISPTESFLDYWKPDEGT